MYKPIIGMTKQKSHRSQCVSFSSYFLQEALCPKQFQDVPSWAANYSYKKRQPTWVPQNEVWMPCSEAWIYSVKLQQEKDIRKEKQT
jgi:hypothetical protein